MGTEVASASIAYSIGLLPQPTRHTAKPPPLSLHTSGCPATAQQLRASAVSHPRKFLGTHCTQLGWWHASQPARQAGVRSAIRGSPPKQVPMCSRLVQTAQRSVSPHPAPAAPPAGMSRGPAQAHARSTGWAAPGRRCPGSSRLPWCRASPQGRRVLATCRPWRVQGAAWLSRGGGDGHPPQQLPPGCPQTRHSRPHGLLTFCGT